MYNFFYFSPKCPDEMDWSKFYPTHFQAKTSQIDEPASKKLKAAENRVEFADIGCGYGGLLGKFLQIFSFALLCF